MKRKDKFKSCAHPSQRSLAIDRDTPGESSKLGQKTKEADPPVQTTHLS